MRAIHLGMLSFFLRGKMREKKKRAGSENIPFLPYFYVVNVRL